MPASADPGDLHARAQDDLAALALGEHIDADVAAHVSDCPLCQYDLVALREVTQLARATGRADDPADTPPPAVWHRILAELGEDAPSAEATPSATTPAPQPQVVTPLVSEQSSRRRTGRLRALLVAAGVVAVAGSGVAGWAIGHSSRTSSPAESSQAVLAARPGTPNDAHGTAVVRTSPLGYTLSVTSNGLPAPQGYYEVWLFDPSINQMVAVGTLGAGGRGTFTVPDGIDLRAYHIVDVSAQKYNGDNRHQRSVLRGALAP